MKRWPLRIQIPLIAVILVILAEVVIGVVAIAIVHNTLTAQIDTRLSETSSVLTRRGPALQEPQAGQQTLRATLLPSEYTVLFHNEEGELQRVVNSGVRTRTDILDFELRTDTEEPYTVTASDSDADWRVLSRALQDGQGTVSVALPLQGVSDATMLLRRSVVILAVVTAVVGAVIAWAVTRASLRPLREAEQTAARIAQGDLSQRITGAGDGTEAGALAQSLNGMLEQLDKAFSAQARSEEKLRAFLADASHELRTPLAAIQGYAELERTGAGSGDGSSLERIEANARRMGALVEDLLVLARYDDSSATLSGTDTVDLAALAQEVAADLRAQDPSRTVTVHVGAPARIQGSPRHLHQMLMNLGANALRHTPAGSPVEIACTPGDTHVNLTVLDHGPGIEESQRDNVFHRFVRLDESRARDTGGTGLGLAIVKAVAEAHGGTVQVQNSADAGAEFTVSLPYSHPSM